MEWALNLCESLFQHLTQTLKLEVAIEILVLKDKRVPESVVGPHLVKRNLALIKPLGTHLCREKCGEQFSKYLRK